MMPNPFRVAMVVCLIMVNCAHAETIYLKGGRVIQGTVLRTTSQEIEVKTESFTLLIPRSQIERMMGGSTAPTAVSTPAPAVTAPVATPEKPAEALMQKSPFVPGNTRATSVTPPVMFTQPPKENISQIKSEELRGILAEALKGQIEHQTTGTLIIPEQKESVSSAPAPVRETLSLAQPSTAARAIPANEPQGEEFRGIWVTRYEWAAKEPATLKNVIVGTLDKIKEANFNVVLFQVRGGGDVLYRSEIEPWSTLVGSQDPGFDPLEFAIEEAHKRGLQLHAGINLYPVWQGEEAPPATTPVHPFLLHCQTLSAINWLCADASGTPMGFSNNYDSYYWLSPGIPEVRAYLRRVITDVVKRYNVDGIHLDRARYPGRQFSHDRVSAARFQGVGNPDRQGWEDWQRQQVNLLIHDLCAEIHAEKPQVCLSASVWGIYNRFALPGYSRFSDGYNDYYQDSLAWLREGYVDAILPMIYWNIQGQGPHFDELLKDFAAHANGQHVFPLIAPANAKEDWLKEIEMTRNLGLKGAAIFSCKALTQGELWEKLTDTVYAKPARVPQLMRQPTPNTGIIMGFVSDANTGKGVEDCVVEIRGASQRTITSGDGFFALRDVAAGDSIAVLAHREDVGSAIASNVALAPGEVKHITIIISK
jgi:uncharacterized lipoprotein YddW (UPF0748 family)